MTAFDPRLYGDKIAERYDEIHADLLDVASSVERLAEVAGSGAVLELGVGTGRTAIALAERGHEVFGIDISPKMIEVLQRKPGGAGVHAVVGDFRDIGIEREFSLVYVIFNTIFALPTQEDQLACFASVAEHLTSDGVFLIEAIVPRFEGRQRLSVDRLLETSVYLEVAHHHPALQRLDSVYVELTDAGVELFPSSLRYVYPAELDLMAALNGLRLRDRWEDWERRPFRGGSRSHVSVYERDETVRAPQR